MEKKLPLFVVLILAACGAGVGGSNVDATPQALTNLTWITWAYASPDTAAPGATVNVTASVTASADTSALVDVEIYSPSGAKVGQRAWDGQAFSAHSARTFSLPWTVPASAGAGTYTLKIGVFKPGWSELFDWEGNAGIVKVTGQSAQDAGTPPPPPPDGGVGNPGCSEQTAWRGTAGFAPLSDVAARARVCTKGENRPRNVTANAYVPSPAELSAFLSATDQYGGSNASGNPYVTHVTGGCGGAGMTTDEIIQCTAAKWGIPADWLRAEYVVESSWEQVDPRTGKPAMGDRNYVGTAAAAKYPDFSRETDANGNLTGYVWQSLGLTQVRYNPNGSVGTGTEPLRWKSSAFNADYQGSVVRYYYDDPQGTRSNWGDPSYHAGQDWWSIGGWFNPYPWQNSGQASYISSVQAKLASRPWEQSGF